MTPRTRAVLRQLHLWVGLVLGLFLAALGLSGSVLVYEDTLTRLLWPPPVATARGTPLPLDRIADIAAGVGGRRRMEIDLPRHPGDAAVVRVGHMSPMVGPPVHGKAADMAAMPGMAMRAASPGVELFIDPVTGKILTMRDALEPPLLVYAHQLHGNLFMGPPGRAVVGWLGVVMTAMGLSGIVLWWPWRGGWRRAFSIRLRASTWRRYRDLHSVIGASTLPVFLIVSFSGVLIALPAMSGTRSAMHARSEPAIPVASGASAIGPDEAVATAAKVCPVCRATRVTLGTRRQPIAIELIRPDQSPVTMLVDPFRNRLLPNGQSTARDLSARTIHRGASFGGWWKAILFVSGILPGFFWLTGITLWLARRPRCTL